MKVVICELEYSQVSSLANEPHTDCPYVNLVHINVMWLSYLLSSEKMNYIHLPTIYGMSTVSHKLC